MCIRDRHVVQRERADDHRDDQQEVHVPRDPAEAPASPPLRRPERRIRLGGHVGHQRAPCVRVIRKKLMSAATTTMTNSATPIAEPVSYTHLTLPTILRV